MSKTGWLAGHLTTSKSRQKGRPWKQVSNLLSVYLVSGECLEGVIKTAHQSTHLKSLIHHMKLIIFVILKPLPDTIRRDYPYLATKFLFVCFFNLFCFPVWIYDVKFEIYILSLQIINFIFSYLNWNIDITHPSTPVLLVLLYPYKTWDFLLKNLNCVNLVCLP